MKKGFIIGLIVIVLTMVSFFLDRQLISLIPYLRNMVVDYFFILIVFFSNFFIIFLFLTLLFLYKKGKQNHVLSVWLSILLSMIVSFVVKLLFKRPRPFEQGLISVFTGGFNLIKDNFSIWNYSFPSFHAMLVFAVLPIINKEFKEFRVYWLVFALLVAFSRVYFGLHYLSDVLLGGLVGYLIGSLVILIKERKK